jgi:ATP-dependent protease HslVU (ClpYQ) peptidase subunit
MTCIVGLQMTDGTIHMGGDRMGSSGHRCMTRADQKVFLNDGYIFGFTSSYRMGQIIRYSFAPPQCDHWDIEKFMVLEFIPSIMETFKENNFGEDDDGGTFLVGYRGRLFKIESDFQVGWLSVPYNSCGSGETVAYGAMHAMEAHSPNIDYTTKINTALDAASEYNSYVRGPYDIVTLHPTTN